MRMVRKGIDRDVVMRLGGLSVLLILWPVLALTALGQQAAPGPSAAEGGRSAVEGGTARTAPGTAPAAVPRVSTHQLAFTIPFQVTAGADGLPPTEVRLYVSQDGGKTWQLYQKQSPGAGKFAFRAAADGNYLFLVRSVDQRGQMYPAGPAFPELEVVVDSQGPQISLDASFGPSGEVRARWQVTDPQLAPNTFVLKYQTGPKEPWQSVAVPSPRQPAGTDELQGATMWVYQSKGDQIVIRAEAEDQLGNRGVAHFTLNAPRAASVARRGPSGVDNQPSTTDTAVRAREAAYPRTPFREVRPPQSGTFGAAAAPDTAGSPADRGTVPREMATSGTRWPATSGGDSLTPPLRRPTMTDGFGHNGPATPSTGVGRGSETNPLTDVARYPPQPATARPPVAERAAPSGIGVGSGVESSYRTARGADGLPPGERPLMTRARRFHLDYGIESIGPSGVRRVELWQTRDGGQTWDLAGVDDDNRSPILVAPAEEGIYGYRIVVESGNGLTGRRPERGDLAEIWIGVDWTKPTAELTSAIYGSGSRAGELEIHWDASDNRLAERCVSLKFSDARSGTWSTIASGLPNDGVYRWRVDGRVPAEIYLRLEVRDEAGNVAVHELERPIPNDGLVPQGTIRGVKPVDEARRRLAPWPNLR